MSEPEGVVLHDQSKDQILTEPGVFLVLTKDGWREMRLRVGRGVIRDLPCALAEAEECD